MTAAADLVSTTKPGLLVWVSCSNVAVPKFAVMMSMLVSIVETVEFVHDFVTDAYATHVFCCCTWCDDRLREDHCARAPLRKHRECAHQRQGSPCTPIDIIPFVVMVLSVAVTYIYAK